MYQSYALDQDILRFNFSGIPILSSGFINQKFINLYINSSQVTRSGSQWEGYRVQLQNTVTNETKDLLVEQTGNYIVFNDDILLQDYNDYNIKIGFVYSQEQSPSPFTNYVNIPQLKPPSQVLNASIASPEDWELARTRLNLTWNTPLNSGSSAILGYQIKQSGLTDNIRGSGLTNTDTFINISGLIPGRSYIYDIRSFNLHGLSDPVFVSGLTSSLVKVSGIITSNSSFIITSQQLYDASVFNASGNFFNLGQKLYDSSVFNASGQLVSSLYQLPFIGMDYVYKLLNLTYIGNIAYSIYGLDYEGSDGDSVDPTILTNSYLYENEKMYSWF